MRRTVRPRNRDSGNELAPEGQTSKPTLPPKTPTPDPTQVSLGWPHSQQPLTIRERDSGGRLVRLINSLFSTTWLKVELVRLARNLYSWTRKKQD